MRILHRFWYRAEDEAGNRSYFGEVMLITENGTASAMALDLFGIWRTFPHGMPPCFESDSLDYVCEVYLRLNLEQALREANVARAHKGLSPILTLTPIKVEAGERPYGFFEQDMNKTPDYGIDWPNTLVGSAPFDVPMPSVTQGDCSL
jgi:hypothetical protein